MTPTDLPTNYRAQLEQAIRDYTARGWGVMTLPYQSKVQRAPWREYQTLPPTPGQLLQEIAQGPVNLAVIFGTASNNLFAFDPDNPDQLKQCLELCADHGIHNPPTRKRPDNGSLHDGGAVILLQAPWPVKTDHKSNAWEILGHGAYAAIAPSVHPGGTQYTLENPGPAPMAPQSLIDALSIQRAIIKPTRHIPAHVLDLLTGRPAAIAKYTKGSEPERSIDNAILLRLARAGFSLDDARRIMANYRTQCPGRYGQIASTSLETANGYLHGLWSECLRWMYENENEDGMLALRLEAWAESRHWPSVPGTRGTTLKAVYLVHVRRVKQCGKQPHHLDVRTTALQAGISNPAIVSKANRALVDLGLLGLVTLGRGRLASTYRLLAPDELPEQQELAVNSDTLHLKTSPKAKCITFRMHDAFRWGALNKSGRDVLEALLSVDGVITERELTVTSKRDRATVKKRLADLMTFEAVEPLGDGQWKATDKARNHTAALLDEIAQAMGTAGKGEAQRINFAKQRRANSAELDRGAELKRLHTPTRRPTTAEMAQVDLRPLKKALGINRET